MNIVANDPAMSRAIGVLGPGRAAGFARARRAGAHF